MPRLAFLGIASPYSPASWSGIPQSTMRELERRFRDFHVIDTPLLDAMVQRLAAFENWGWLPSREPSVSALFDRLVGDRIRRLQPDAIVSIGAAHKVGGIARGIPLVHVTDALFPTIIDYYPRYKGLSGRSQRIGLSLQAKLVERADAIVLASDWAASSAADHYPHARSKLHVVPFGANLASPPDRVEVREPRGAPRLLFVGYDWNRKNGEFLLAVHQALRALAPAAQLHIVGCSPDLGASADGVRLHGRLRKSIASERALLDDLFRQSHFFIMPSQSEAFGIAYCEACAFGLPPVGMRTGGVPTIIHDGVNGLLIEPGSQPDAVAQRLIEVWGSAERYRDLQVNARQDFLTRLNWSAWGHRIEEIILAAVAGREKAAG